MQQIIVDIDTDGAIKIDAKGFTGTDCEEATQFLEAALGVITERQHKPEYRQQATRQQSHQQRLGK